MELLISGGALGDVLNRRGVSVVAILSVVAFVSGSCNS